MIAGLSDEQMYCINSTKERLRAKANTNIFHQENSGTTLQSKFKPTDATGKDDIAKANSNILNAPAHRSQLFTDRITPKQTRPFHSYTQLSEDRKVNAG